MTAHVTPAVLPHGAILTSKLFNDAFAKHANDLNTHIDETDFPHPILSAFVHGATSAATGSTGFLRDSLGGGALSSLAIGGVSGSIYGLNIQSFRPLGDAAGVPFELIRDSTLATVRSLDKNGNQTNVGSITAPSFIGPATSAGQFSGLLATANGTNNTVHYTAGTIVNSQGIHVDIPATDVNFASSVSVSGNLWIAVSINDAGTFVLTPGVLSGLKGTAITPAGNVPINTVLLRQNNTAIFKDDDFTVLHGFLGPRPVSSAFGSGGGNTDLLQTYIQPDLKGRLSISGSNVILTAGTGVSYPATPFTVGIAGVKRTFTAPVTTTMSASGALGGASGTVYLVLDVSNGTIFFTGTGTSLTTYQMIIARYYSVAGTLATFVDLSPVQSVATSQTIPQISQVTVSNSLATNHLAYAPGGFAADTGTMALNIFNVPVPMTVKIRSFAHVKYHLAAAGDIVNHAVYINGVVPTCASGKTYPTWGSTTGAVTWEEYIERTQWVDLPSPGFYQIGQYWNTINTATVDLLDRDLTVEFYALRQVI